ncbi:hypothetical protein V6N11_009178 [Hibiscus sabdariffa]|uniref:Uncharacterized protein n=1 Tax=Hibiscus sabdariffa TaxID=183260 RepID=A0ABR2PQ22_9ROSI
MEENPSYKTLVTHVFLGGRPPDVATPDVSLPVRERSSSGETNLDSFPMFLGDSLGNSDPRDVVSGEQGLSKISAHDPVSTDVVMEAPIVPPSSPNNGSPPVGLQTSPEGLSSNSAGVSYATMVAKNLRNIPGAGGDIVQDKDNCARNTSTAPLSDVTPAAEVTPVLEPMTVAPYGPWMVVHTRRRRPPPRQANPSKRVVSNASHEVEVPGTQFLILAGNDDHGGSESTDLNPIVGAKAHSSTSVGKESSGISLNEAYMASNPQKKSKHASRAGLIPEIVSIVDGEDIEVVPHVVYQQPDKHAAVAIVENIPRKSTGGSSHGLSGVSSELSDKERLVSASGDGLTVDTGQVPTVTEGASTVQAVMRQ